MPVRAYGFCFPHAVDMVPCCDHDEVLTFNSMESTILGHLAANVKYYEWFPTGDVLKDAERYSKFRNYCDNGLDIIVIATTRALKLSLIMYQKGPKGNIQILEQTKHATGKEVHLKFTWESHLANNHHEAILLLHKPAERHREDVVTIESPCSSTLEQPISQDDADDVVDLKDDSEMTAIHQLELVQYSTSNNELQFPTYLFVNIAAEWMDDLPQDIDGFKVYKIKCLPREWINKSHDLRYFKMHSLRRKTW